MGSAAEVYVSSDCPVCKKVVEEMRVRLGDKFDRAVVVKDVESDSSAQMALLRMNFISTPVLRIENRTWAVNQLTEDAIRQVCTNLSERF